MQRLSALLCLAFCCAASAALDPRGARPVEPGTRSEKCETQREWPFCTDDQWGSKCPSGCRIQGLVDKYDHDALKRMEKIRSLLQQNQQKHRSADQVTKQTYDFLRDKLTVDSGHDNDYYGLAQRLRQRITDMKIKIDLQLRILGTLKEQVKDQVVEMQRLEVDIDIKLRSCKGSCETHHEHHVDQESYVTLDKQVHQLDSQSAQNIEAAGTLFVMTSRPMKDAVVDTVFKSKDVDGSKGAQKTEDIFNDVQTVQLVIGEEGSKLSPATISKVPGTSFSSSSSSSTSSSSSSSSKSITELGGGGDLGGGLGSTSTKSLVCTRRIKTTVVQTANGPEERREEVVEGGPECQTTAGLSGGLSSLFPSLTSSSSSVTKTVHTSGTKGSLLDTKTSSVDPFADFGGVDLGGFLTAAADEDVPDFHARSVKSTRTERHSGYVGTDCVDARQKHLRGETNGLFKIKPGGGGGSTQVVEVYCQQEGLMGGWLLVQQREGGALGFNRTWAEYRDGFGSVDAGGKGELWLGNQKLHLLTGRGDAMLKVELEDWEGGVASAEYSVRVGPEQEAYPLHVSGYAGDAGDALEMPESDMASYLSHNGMKFSTFDRDGDRWEESCAEVFGGGWWYNNCQAANLNGIYYSGRYDPERNAPYEVENGVVWTTYKPANYSLRSVRMFVRPAVF